MNRPPTLPFSNGPIAALGITTLVATIFDCGEPSETIAAAMASVRGTRRRIRCDRRSVFTSVPAELLDRAR